MQIDEMECIEKERLILYPLGQVKGRSFYLNGLLHGPSCFYSPEGKLLSKTYFHQGKAIGECLQFYLSGCVYAKLYYEEGHFQGKQEYFYENGQLKSVMSYEKGVLDGEVFLFWPSGALKRRSFFVKGIKNQKEQILTDDGVVLDEGEFLEGRPVGVHQRRYPNGILRSEKIYDPKGHCDTRRWDEKGRLEYEGIYPNENTFKETKFFWPKGTKIEREGMWDGERCHFK